MHPEYDHLIESARTAGAAARSVPDNAAAPEITARSFTRWFLSQERGHQADWIKSVLPSLSDLVGSVPDNAALLQDAIDSPALQDAIYEDMVANWPAILGDLAPPEHVEQAKQGARRSALQSANAVRAYLLHVTKEAAR